MPQDVANGLTFTEIGSDEMVAQAQSVTGALAIIESISGGFYYRAPIQDLQLMFAALLVNMPLGILNIGKPFKSFRGRINNKKVKMFRCGDYSYRPLSKGTSYGRCHLPGTEMLYASWNIDTVLSELAPDVGDKVHIGACQIKQDQRLDVAVLGEFDFSRRFERHILEDAKRFEEQKEILDQMSNEMKTRTFLIDAFFSDIFARPATKQRDYRASGTLCDTIFKVSQNKQGQPIYGFIYPSVGHRGGLNVAIKPESVDNKMEWTEFATESIELYLGFGIYGTRTIARSSGLSAKGRIIWN